MDNYYLDWSQLTQRVYITNGKKKKDVTESYEKIVADISAARMVRGTSLSPGFVSAATELVQMKEQKIEKIELIKEGDGYKTKCGRVLIHKHINCPGEFLFTCRELDIYGVRIGLKTDAGTDKLLDAIYDIVHDRKDKLEDILSLLVKYK